MVKNPPANAGDVRDENLIPGSGRFSWRREWQHTPVFLPGEPPKRGADYRLWGYKELDMTEAT